MIIVITGLAGSGKTWLMSRMLKKEWKAGTNIHANYKLYFSDDGSRVFRWHALDETYNLTDGIISIDDGQRLFEARRWASLPIGFLEKISLHRHDKLDIITTTQDLAHIDLRIRQNIHELINIKSIFRLPRNQRMYPFLQLVRISKKRRKVSSSSERLIWEKDGRNKWRFISRFWTKRLYDTYEDISTQRYLCKIKFEKSKWSAKIVSRDLLNRGKARL